MISHDLLGGSVPGLVQTQSFLFIYRSHIATTLCRFSHDGVITPLLPVEAGCLAQFVRQPGENLSVVSPDVAN